MSIFKLALTFFVVTNPIGNSPTILALIKDYDFQKQKSIMMREGLIALFLAIFFLFFGDVFLSSLNIADYALSLSGGIILLLTAFSMIFKDASTKQSESIKKEPFIVPIATPLLSGAGLFSIIMVNARLEQNYFYLVSAILIAWVGVLGVLYAAPYLMRLLGKRGLAALEQIMGLVLALIATEMLLSGSGKFIQSLPFTFSHG